MTAGAERAATCDAVIVNFRSPGLVEKCVGSIRAHALVPDSAIVVVDNGSGDGSAERLAAALPGITVLPIRDNRGFGAGVNAGVAHCRGDIVLVLNPDTHFIDRSLMTALALMRADPGIGIVGLDLRNPDGSRQHSARRFYSGLDILVRRTPMKGWRLFAARQARHLMAARWRGQLFDVDWVMGTGFLIRRAAFEAVGGMDPGFFLYMEDVDLCRRVWNAGWRVVAAVDAVLIHDHQRASAVSPFSASARHHLRSLLRYARKHGMPLLNAGDPS